MSYISVSSLAISKALEVYDKETADDFEILKQELFKKIKYDLENPPWYKFWSKKNNVQENEIIEYLNDQLPLSDEGLEWFYTRKFKSDRNAKVKNLRNFASINPSIINVSSKDSFILKYIPKEFL